MRQSQGEQLPHQRRLDLTGNCSAMPRRGGLIRAPPLGVVRLLANGGFSSWSCRRLVPATIRTVAEAQGNHVFAEKRFCRRKCSFANRHAELCEAGSNQGRALVLASRRRHRSTALVQRIQGNFPWDGRAAQPRLQREKQLARHCPLGKAVIAAVAAALPRTVVVPAGRATLATMRERHLSPA